MRVEFSDERADPDPETCVRVGCFRVLVCGCAKTDLLSQLKLTGLQKYIMNILVSMTALWKITKR